jgi:hypothetical protein
VAASTGNGEEQLVKDAERSFARTRQIEMVVVTVACIAALAALGVSVWLVRLVYDCTNPGGACFEKNRVAQMTFRDELRGLIRDVGQCQTLQLLQHRDANEKAHALNASEHGYPYAAPAGETPPSIPDQLKEACAQFIPRAQGGTR